MVSVTQRITQYTKQVGQPRGGLINPRQLVMTQLDDGKGALDNRLENVSAVLVGSAVDYLTRLANVRTHDAITAAQDSFRISLKGARRISTLTEHVSAEADAEAALLELMFVEQPDGTVVFVIDDTAVRVACQLASYDVGARNDPALYNPALVRPDQLTTEHILQMVTRAEGFFDAYGPVIKDGFLFADPVEHMFGNRGGYTDLVNSGDGDFLTADTLWDFKVSKSKPSKDNTLQLLMYFLMGKQSGLPEFEELTHVGIFNPRLNAVFRLEVSEVPADVIETVRRDVIGYAA